ncbi:hypothetical protein QF003_004603 [Leclercia adecarboxylata]
MAWVSVRQAMELTGKGRSSLYRDMSRGRVSYRSEVDGGRLLDTSELIRVYGALRQVTSPERDGERQLDETRNEAMELLVSEIKLLREEVAGLRMEIQANRLLEHKAAELLAESDVAENTAADGKKWWAFWQR